MRRVARWVSRTWAKGLASRLLLIVAVVLLFPLVLLGALLVVTYELIAAVDRRGRLTERDRWIAAAAVIGTLAILGSLQPRSPPGAATAPGGPVPGAATATGSPAPGAFSVTSPATGSTIETDTIAVVGTAPAGSEVVWDIPFRFDQRTVAYGGQWSMQVPLTDGINRLTFRMGNDKATAITLVLTYRPATVIASPTPIAAPSSLEPTATAPSATPNASVTPKPLPTPPITTLADKTGDMVDENDEPVADGPPYQDIISSVVKVDQAGNLVVSIDTAGDAPTSWDPVRTEIVYGYFVETTGDETPDYQVLLQNDFDNRWTASVSEIATGQTLSDDRFPGFGTVLGSLASIRLDLVTLGSPHRLKIATFTQSIVYANPQSDPYTYVQRTDSAPDHQFPDESPDWIVFVVPA